MEKKRILLLDMYGVIIKESKGNFILLSNDVKEWSKYLFELHPQECIFVDNSVQNLNAAKEIGINTVLFNRDNEDYCGNIVNDFQELDCFLKKLDVETGATAKVRRMAGICCDRKT